MSSPARGHVENMLADQTEGSDDNWLRDFRQMKQSILMSPAGTSSTGFPSPARRISEVDPAAVNGDHLDQEIKSIVDILQDEDAANKKLNIGSSHHPMIGGKEKAIKGPYDRLTGCAPAASPLSSSSSSSSESSRASSPESTPSPGHGGFKNSSSHESSCYSPNAYQILRSEQPLAPPFNDDPTEDNRKPSYTDMHRTTNYQELHQAPPSWAPEKQHEESSLARPPSDIASDNLLRMLYEEKERGQGQKARIQGLEVALAETTQEKEVAMASARLEIHELRGMLRRVASESTFSDVFTLYEAHIARVEKEANVLRDRNVHLEAWRLDQRQQSEESRGQGRADACGGEGDSQGCNRPDRPTPSPSRKNRKSLHGATKPAPHNAQDTFWSPTSALSTAMRMNGSQPAPTGVLVALKGKVKELQRQVNDLKQETGELRRRERQFLVQKRMVETTWARVQKVQFMAKGLESSLASSRLDGARAEARLEEAEGEIRALRQREAVLVMDRDRCLQELEVIRRQLGGVGNARGSAFSKGTHGRERDCPRR